MKSSNQLSKAHRSGSFHRLVFESSPSNGGEAWRRSFSYQFMQLVVLVIRSITPLSYLYLFCLWYFNPLSDYFKNKWMFYLLTFWTVAEAAFFPFYYHLFNILNVTKSPLKHYAINQEARIRLLKSCFQAMKQAREDGVEPHIHLRKMMEGWFLGANIASIHMDNIRSWVSWAFFGHDILEMRPYEVEETAALVEFIEQELKFQFPPGNNEAVHSIRLTLDPLFATQRPLFYYATIAVVNFTAHVLLWLAGYRRRRGLNGSTKAGITDRVRSISGRLVEAETLAVYYKPAVKRKTAHQTNDNTGRSNSTGKNNNNNNNPNMPIVFVHGIGIGFAHYLGLLFSLPSDVDIYLLEWPHVSMQLTSLVPSIEHTVRTLVQVLDDDNHDQACFLTHSLGSTAVSWMLHDPRAATKVGATVMLDPVTFLLCDPTVASSFIHREPESTFEFLVHFFVARELHVANALSRHFSWSHNMVFVEELPAVKGKISNSIFLASNDGIIPTASVARYLEAKRVTGHSLEALLFHGTHGEMMLHPRWVRLIAQKVREKVYHE